MGNFLQFCDIQETIVKNEALNIPPEHQLQHLAESFNVRLLYKQWSNQDALPSRTSVTLEIKELTYGLATTLELCC
jgi:hypothetical protein